MPVPRKKLRLIDVTYVEHDMFDQLLLVPRIGGGVRRKMYKEVSVLDRCNIAMERTIIICRPNDRDLGEIRISLARITRQKTGK